MKQQCFHQRVDQNSGEQDASVQQQKMQKTAAAATAAHRMHATTAAFETTATAKTTATEKQQQRKVTGPKPTIVTLLSRAISVVAEMTSPLMSLRGDGCSAGRDCGRG